MVAFATIWVVINRLSWPIWALPTGDRWLAAGAVSLQLCGCGRDVGQIDLLIFPLRLDAMIMMPSGRMSIPRFACQSSCFACAHLRTCVRPD